MEDLSCVIFQEPGFQVMHKQVSWDHYRHHSYLPHTWTSRGGQSPDNPPCWGLLVIQTVFTIRKKPDICVLLTEHPVTECSALRLCGRPFHDPYSRDVEHLFVSYKNKLCQRSCLKTVRLQQVLGYDHTRGKSVDHASFIWLSATFARSTSCLYVFCTVSSCLLSNGIHEKHSRYHILSTSQFDYK